MTKNKESQTLELRVRDFPRIQKNKVEAYRLIKHRQEGGKKPSFREALGEMIDHAYQELAVKKIEDG
jgi:hypothetical protein